MIDKDDQDNRNDDELRNQHQQDADNDYGLPEAEYNPIERDQPLSGQEESTAYSNLYEEDERGHESKKKDSTLLVILILAGIIVLAGVFIYMFAFDNNSESEQVTQKPTVVTPVVVEEEPEETIPEEAWEEPEEPVVAEGSVSTIGSRTGRYYLIVGSFIDSDLAKDYADRLAKDGYQAKIIEPSGTRKFYRLSVNDAGSISELQANIDSMKEKHGENVWIVKY